jgi:DNA-binding MarR family transcriptional regulator
MSPPQPLTTALREWSEVFMHRSSRDFKHFLSEASLSFSQVNVIMRLYHDGSAAVSELGREMGVTNAAASQVIDRLVQHDIIARTEDPADRRVKRLALSDKGRHLVSQAMEARSRWLEGLASSLEPAQQEEIISALKLLTEAARKISE